MTTADDTALTALYARLCQAWADGDAEAYGTCFTDDSDYVSFDGSRAAGRRPMVDAHDKLFRGVLAGSSLVGDVESIRYIRDDVAIMHATGSVLMPWRSTAPKSRLSRQTIVAVREHGEWRFAAFHNGRVRPVTIPGPDSFPAKASRLMTRIARGLGAGRTSNAVA